MVCFILPTIAWGMVYAHRRIGKRGDAEGHRLNLLLAGGAVFGLVDHWWNGELYPPAGADIASDLVLGVLITAAIYAVWFAMLLVKQNSSRPANAVA